MALVALAASLVPSATRADPCEGGHYEYDHGECYDRSGDTTGDMLKMYDAGDRLQQGIIDRSRSIVGGAPAPFAGGRMGLPASTRDAMFKLEISAFHALSFRPRATSGAIDDLTRSVPAASRGRARGMMRELLRTYRTTILKARLLPDVLTTGYLYSIVAAFATYDGDRWSSPDIAMTTWWELTVDLASMPAMARMENEDLQRVNDDLALTGATMLLLAADARARHDRAALARVRKRALDFLIGYHRIDPRKTRLDDLLCVANHMGMVGTCDEMKFFVTGGRVGSFELTR
ncbi:MAG: hypothetical protein NVSMB21_10250 [Vulcanimicrobiaceae bacterium]